MASTQLQRPSLFLALPRELRDIIYDLTLEPSRPLLKPSKTRLKVQVENAPHPQLRLLNRQIKDEYDSRNKLWTRLLLADHKFFDFSTTKLDPLPSVRSVSVKIFVTCDACNKFTRESCAATDQMKRHRRWLAEVLDTLPERLPVRLEVSVWSDGEHDQKWPDDLGHCRDTAVQVRNLARLPGVTSIVVYQSEKYCYDVVEGFRDGLVCARWMEKAGWQGVGEEEDC